MKKTKFSIIDVLIVLFLIVVLGFGFKKVRNNGIVVDKPLKRVSVSILASRGEEGSGKVINIGDNVCISLKEKEYATITNVTEIPYKEIAYVQNLGKYASTPVDGKSDLIVELECMADVSETEILDGKAPIRVGESATIHGKGYSFQGYFVNVEEMGDE